MQDNTPELVQPEFEFTKLCECGCGKPVAKPGNRFLHNHHNNVREHQPIGERFWLKVSIGSVNECWLWMGSCFPKGYGQFSISGISVGAHRVAYALTYGEIVGDTVICHDCDNPPCCNPSHLFAGTTLDNVMDKIEKGRGNFAQGERHGLARFTNGEAERLRAQFSDLNISVLQFAILHNVPDETMRRLLNRVTYKNA